MAEHTRICEFPASDRDVTDYLSRRDESGSSFDSFTSVNVNLLMKISSPFQEVCKTSPGGSSEISSSL